VLVAGDASAGADAQTGKDAGTAAAAKTVAPVVTKETVKVDDATTFANAVAMSPTAQDVRPNEPTKMVVPPTRIDTVAVAAARASIDANRPIRLTVRLDPPNLGELRVELTARGSQVTVRLEPTSANVAPTLSQQRSAVAEALERTGFQLSGFDIANPEQQQQQQQAFSQKRNAARVAAVEELETDDVAPAEGLRI
jgi:flagellar hook-length control protein FliK